MLMRNDKWDFAVPTAMIKKAAQMHTATKIPEIMIDHVSMGVH